MNGPKMNLGNSLFNKELKIEELSRDNCRLEQLLKESTSELKSTQTRNQELEKRLADLEARLRSQDLDLAQAIMKLRSAETASDKQRVVSMAMKETGEANLGRIDALSRENIFLQNKLVETESDRDRLASDLKLLASRLDKAQKTLAEMQEVLSKKQGDIALLEKTLARKNDHLDILLKKDKELMAVQKTKKQEIMAEKLMEATECKVIESGTEREWREAAQAAQTQAELLKKKIRRLEEEKSSLEKENKKVKDDNFYLVNRLKTKK